MDPLSAALAEVEENGNKTSEILKEVKDDDDDHQKSGGHQSPTKAGDENKAESSTKNKQILRTKLPVKQPDKNNANFWTFLKQCIGKELTKITMPVQWNEPISLLQRVSEYMNYAYLLRKASVAKTSEARLEMVATFAVSALASNFERMGKPFNPLLGETYELIKDDFRIVCEQVGHHPPVSAWHADGGDEDFVFRGSIYPKVKFWGKSVEFRPQGVCSLQFPKWENETYTWHNVNCIIHNVIVGSLWMEQQGTMEIINQATNARCVLNFRPGGWFSSGSNDLHTVEGFILDQHKKKIRFIYGRWTEFICSVDIKSLEEHLGGNTKVEKLEANASNLPKHAPFELCDIPNSSVLWHVDPRPEDSADYYNFSNFTMGLNEFFQENIHKDLCSTDSRHRPDIRAMENGDLEKAAQEKDRLENKQREYRKPYKSCKKESDWWTPKWFMPSRNEFTKEDDWTFLGDYWKKSRSPESQLDIF